MAGVEDLPLNRKGNGELGANLSFCRIGQGAETPSEGELIIRWSPGMGQGNIIKQVFRNMDLLINFGQTRPDAYSGVK